MKTGILLVNTGSPDTYHPGDVKKYLQEFLMDERVIDLPKWQRNILVNGIIAPLRSKKSAKLYENIWEENGSPLINITRKLSTDLEKHVKIETQYAMRYGNPSIKSALSILHFKGIENVILIPMFPHYAMSTYESVVEKTRSDLKFFNFKNLSVIPPFFNNEKYIKAISENAKNHLNKKTEAVIFSYHSLPKRHITKADQTGEYCLKRPDCCSRKSKVHEFCYRAQTYQTTRLLSGLSTFSGMKIIHSYQSAMNKNTWIGPDTEDEIIQLAKDGIKNLAVICPGFVTDNLETLEEINIRARNLFLKNGGSLFTYVPALNYHKAWIQAITSWILNETKKK